MFLYKNIIVVIKNYYYSNCTCKYTCGPV